MSAGEIERTFRINKSKEQPLPHLTGHLYDKGMNPAATGLLYHFPFGRTQPTRPPEMPRVSKSDEPRNQNRAVCYWTGLV